MELNNVADDEIDFSSSHVKLLKEEPFRYGSENSVNELLVAAEMRGVSDLSIVSDGVIHAQINGRPFIASSRALQPSEVDAILSVLWRSGDASGILRQGRPLDFAYEVKLDRATRRRYRVNATGITAFNAVGAEIAIRSLPHLTPSLDSVKFEDEVRDYLNPKSGIVVVAGGTGHGKSTTLAAITRMHLESRDTPKKILDYQAPIEFTYRDILDANADSGAFVIQSEIGEGRNLPTFGKAIWTSLRRAPHIINVGEARDYESMSGCVTAALQGHVVNTTTHAGSVAETLRRMVVEFPSDQQKSRAYDLITSLKLVVAQHLVPSSDQKSRFAVREYLAFTDVVRDRFLETDTSQWTRVTKGLFKDKQKDRRIVGRSLEETIDLKIRDGSLTEEVARNYLGNIYF
jgi:defect-in-organelle-trafficking protein DotB